jgi:hypothetical protein
MSAIAVSRQTGLSSAMKDQQIVVIVAVMVVVRASSSNGGSGSSIGSGSTGISPFT